MQDVCALLCQVNTFVGLGPYATRMKSAFSDIYIYEAIIAQQQRQTRASFSQSLLILCYLIHVLKDAF